MSTSSPITPSERLDYTIVAYQPEHQADFYRLNAAWIAPTFGLEDEDIRFLSNPQAEIIDKGGAVFVACLNTQPDRAIATGGLFKMDEETYELIRLAVDQAYRGFGLGKALTRYALELAKAMGGKRVILESSKKPVNQRAVAMYEAMGFRHYRPKPEHRSALDRAEVWMLYEPL